MGMGWLDGFTVARIGVVLASFTEDETGVDDAIAESWFVFILLLV
jgi:hypothetical protein